MSGIGSRTLLAAILLFLVAAHGSRLTSSPASVAAQRNATAPPATSEPRQPAARRNLIDSIAPPDFDQALRLQAGTDRAWRSASAGVMRMEKITYRSRIGDLDIPAFVFQPVTDAAPRSRAAIVWVHENVRGHLYEHFIPYVREAVSRGFVVIAPEYRGSIGYGRAFYDAIDYGGAEVDDVITAVSVLRNRYGSVDPARIGLIGWSHGGLIALLAVARSQASFKAAAAIVPVTNLFQRFAWKGEEALRATIDPQNRLGGLPAQRRAIYRDRSPLFHVDAFTIPLLVHVAENDEDVNIEEAMPLIDALRARKAGLAETMVYKEPPGGHLFDRQVDERTLKPENTPEQVDSWRRVWSFFDRHLQPADR
jgi:dipeptidyl aminopeptidase/acylaminoacyl peptidase